MTRDGTAISGDEFQMKDHQTFLRLLRIFAAKSTSPLFHLSQHNQKRRTDSPRLTRKEYALLHRSNPRCMLPKSTRNANDGRRTSV